MKITVDSLSNCIPATNAMRIKARVADVLLMVVLSLMAYSFSSYGDFLHSKRLVFCFTTLFFLLLYCPLLDKTGGTIGKRVFGITVISIVPITTKITLFQSYKRMFALRWVLLVAIIMQILVHYGYYDKDYGINEDGEKVWSSSLIYFGYMTLL